MVCRCATCIKPGTIKVKHELSYDTSYYSYYKYYNYYSDYLAIIFPRWVVNKKACDRLLELLSNITVIIMFWSKPPKSKQPSSRNAVKDGVDDELITTTLSIFTFVASLLEPFFKKYQCDKPMTYVSRFKIFDGKFA